MPLSPSKSPAKSPKLPTPSYASTKTKRSSVSKAFDNNRLLKDPNATASVGTMTDPSATAPDILASGPNIKMTKQASSLAGSSASGASRGASSASVVSSGASRTPTPPSGHVPSTFAPTALINGSKAPSAVASQPGSSVNKQATTVLGQSQAPQTLATQDGTTGQVVVEPLINADGLIVINTRKGMIFELILSVIAAVLFAAIFIYFVAQKCNNIFIDQYSVYVESAYVLIGLFTSIFLIFHSCFERGFQAGRGVFGCIIFFVVSGAIVVNAWGAFRLAYYCVCSCRKSESAFHPDARAENLVLFLMDFMACVCLILVLLISSVSHD